MNHRRAVSSGYLHLNISVIAELIENNMISARLFWLEMAKPIFVRNGSCGCMLK
jgi:hypothetical protein